MDYTVVNNARLFDELLKVLNRYQAESGMIAALEDLKAAKVNYVQRSIDHMMNCLVLAIHDLTEHPHSPELWRDLKSVVDELYGGILHAGSRFSNLAHEYEAAGGKLLSREEILKEVDERRGSAR